MINIDTIVNTQKKYFLQGNTLSYSFRLDKLRRLSSALYTWEKPIMEALYKDLGKSSEESYMSEIAIVNHEIKYLIKNLKSLMKKKKVKTPIMHFPSKSYIINEPLGNTLIMSPWNYPLLLTLSPLVSAIAGGNTAIIKPSRYSENTSIVLKNMLNSIFSRDYVEVILGGSKINQELLDHKFDFIFFTGSKTVGKIVMKKAAEFLTPIVLELGGKSPVYVDSSANIKVTASRLVWGKFLNVGQTCVAPDYVLCHQKVYQKLLLAIKNEIINMYGDNPLYNKEYGKIINEKHFNRLTHLLDDGTLSYGGYLDPETRKISPAILVNVDFESPLMQDEIFGPILPVIKVGNFNEAVSFIKSKPKPLASYIFTHNSKQIEFFNNNLSFGGGCINDCIIHLANPNMPFGGIGESGMGSYHGKKGYETFTHNKSIVKKSTLIDLKLRKPPLNNKMNKLKKLL
ncbi:MAG: aldehyde dehydrogenase [Pleomorphochaeta sp.]